MKPHHKWILFLYITLFGILIIAPTSNVNAQIQNAQSCEKNDDCPENTFCAFGCRGGIMPQLPFEETFKIICHGFCVPLTGQFRTVYKGPDSDILDKSGKIVFKRNSLITSSTPMMWHTANNWCLAHNKKLVDISNNRLDCAVPKNEKERENLFDRGSTDVPCVDRIATGMNDQVSSLVIQRLFPFLSRAFKPKYRSLFFWTNALKPVKNNAVVQGIDLLGMTDWPKFKYPASISKDTPFSDLNLPLCE